MFLAIDWAATGHAWKKWTSATVIQEMKTHRNRLRSNASRRLSRVRFLSIALVATVLLAAAVTASAAATSSIEGVWSFNGGQIAIKPEGSGKFEGIVVSPTTFETCIHEVGEPVWKGLTLQADGSYWGTHQWFYAESNCTKNPTRGLTAWRVISEPNGSRFIRVCLSEPGQPQPTLPPNDTSAHPGQTCLNSALVASLPSTTGSSGTAASKETLSLPSAKKCLSVRLFPIHLLDPKFDPFKQVVVTLKGKKIATHRHGKYIISTINLRRLPRGAFTIKIRATTVLGHHLSASRTYHTCVKKIVKKKTTKKG